MQVKQLVIAILTPLVTGIATFGAIALHHHRGTWLGALRVYAAAQSSPEPESLLVNWPRQCKMLRQELLSHPELSEITYEARPLSPFVTPAWKLNWQGDTIALPIVNYSDVRVARNEDGQLMVVLEDRKAGARVMLNRLKQVPPLADVFATAPHPSLTLAQLQGQPAGHGTSAAEMVVDSSAVKASASALAAPSSSAPGPSTSGEASPQLSVAEASVGGATVPNWDGPSLTERLFDGPVSLEELIDLGYRDRPQSLGCRANDWEKELPLAMGLALKLTTGSGDRPEAVYAKVGQKPGRLLRLQVGKNRVWQARFGEGEFYSDVMITLPSDHESAAVGLGMGQENWWDSEPRPEWLVALERALETDSLYAWQALSVELYRAGMSPESAGSIQRLTAE